MNDQEQRFEAWRDEYEAREGHAFPGRLEVWEAAEEPLLARIAELEAALTVPDYAMPPDGQEWAKVIPEVAFHLIERHAENWAHAGKLMEAWRDATTALPETPSPEMIRAALAVQWPALYKDGLHTEHDGESLRAQTAQRVEIVRRQYRAMVEAMKKEPT